MKRNPEVSWKAIATVLSLVTCTECGWSNAKPINFNLARVCRAGKQWKHGKDHSVSGGARVLMRLRAFSQVMLCPVVLCPSSIEETLGCVCRAGEGLPGS